MGIRGSSVKVRMGTPDDAAAVRALVEEAFDVDEGRTINSALSELDARGLSQAFCVAEAVVSGRRRPVGVAGLSRVWIDARQELVDALLVSPLAVSPAFHGQGVGSALLKACVRYGEDVKAPLLVLEGDPRYYGARGFTPAASHGLVRPSDRIPSPACQVRLLRDHQKWMTGRIVYPDTWWRHDLVGLRDPQLAEIEVLLPAGQ